MQIDVNRFFHIFALKIALKLLFTSLLFLEIVREDFHKWHSLYLNRDFEMLVFGQNGLPIIIFPTSGGRYFEAKDRGLINSVAEYINKGLIKIYCPDSINSESWYNNSIQPADRVKTHLTYEKLILKEVIDFARFETECERVSVAGCSFGGYQASNLAFRHPDVVSNLITMGGAFDIKRFIYGHYDTECYFNNPPDYLPNLNDDWYLERFRNMGMIFGTGEWDMCLEENRRISSILNSKKLSHWLDVRNSTGHDWHWWHQMFRDYVARILN